jgi:TRAP-type C4-dicarboxylate transport system permease small subunit
VAGTDMPVRLTNLLTFLCLGLSAAGLSRIAWNWSGTEQNVSPLLVLVTLGFFLFSLVFFCLGMIARYLVALLDETRKRPPYLVKEEHFKESEVVLGPVMGSRFSDHRLEINE